MKKYRIKTKSKRFLEQHKFKFNSAFSSDGDEYYSITFPVCEWLEYVTLWGEIRVQLNTGYVWIDVYDKNDGTRTKYAPFYYHEFGNYEPILNSIWREFNKQFKELDIAEVKREYERKNQVYQESKRRNYRATNKDSTRRLDRSQSRRGRKPRQG